MKQILLSCLIALSPLPALAHEDGSSNSDPEFEASSLAHNLDDMVKTCSSMVASTANKTGPYRPEQLMRQAGRLQDLSDPGREISGLANPKYGPATFFRWFDPHADIVLMNYTETPYCRAFIDNAVSAGKARTKLEALVQVGDFWQLKTPNEATPSGPRSTFAAKVADGASEVQLSITGFVGDQGTVAVALIEKNAR